MRIVRIKKPNQGNKSNRLSQQKCTYYQTRTKYDDQELEAMQRSPIKPSYHGNLFCVLTKQLFWSNVDPSNSKQ